MTFAEWLKSFLKFAPRSSYVKIRKTYLLKNYNDINWDFIYYVILMLGKYLKKIEFYLKSQIKSEWFDIFVGLFLVTSTCSSSNRNQ